MRSKRRGAFNSRWIIAFLLQLALLAPAGLQTVQASEVSEYDIKALYLYHFTQFVTWPKEETEKPFIIGIIGDNPFGGELKRIVLQQDPQERKIEIRETQDDEDVFDCQILFVSRSEKRSLGGILAKIGKRPILTVGDDDTFALRGCVLGFAVEDNKVRIIVNKRAAAEASLELSSKLLRVAQVR